MYGNTAKGLQAIADLSLCDESKTPEGKNAVIEFTFYVPCEEKGAAPLLMQDMVALIGKPVSTFWLSVKNADGRSDVDANDDFFFKPAAGPKAGALTASAAELENLPSENKHKLTREQTWQPREARDFLSMRAPPHFRFNPGGIL